MPSRLPLKDLFFDFGRKISSTVKIWIHYILVVVSWLGIVPLTVSRMYNCLFSGLINTLTSLPVDMQSTKNILEDIVLGTFIVVCSLGVFICLAWLKFQILNGNLPAWLRPVPEEVLPVAGQPANAMEENQENNENVNNNINGQNQEEVEPQPLDVNNNPLADNNVRDDNINWIPLDWENGGIGPILEKIFGLDGSLLFLKHVFWLIVWNTLTILVFAYFPYHLGNFFIVNVGLAEYVLLTKVEGILTALCGYILVFIGSLICHSAFQLKKCLLLSRMFGLCFIVLTICILVLVRIGVLPSICGICLDICTLKIFNSTLQSRKIRFLSAPGESIFYYWIEGIIFMFYCIRILILLKKILRPGVLWFFAHLNYHNFSLTNEMNEMVRLSVYCHCRRLLITMITIGFIVLSVAWLPEQLLLSLVPNLLPFPATGQQFPRIGEFILTFSFLLRHFETIRIMAWIEAIIRWWCYAMETVLGMRSYLLIDEDFAKQNNYLLNNEFEHLPQNLLQQLQAAPNVNIERNLHQLYRKPTYFSLKLVLLIVCIAFTFTITSSAVIWIPIYVGRFVFNVVYGENGLIFSSGNDIPVIRENFIFSLGLCLCFGFIYACSVLHKWILCGWRFAAEKCKGTLFLVGKVICFGIFVFAIIPFLLGLLFKLVIEIPLEVPLHQTPTVNFPRIWVSGLFIFKFSISILLTGPDNWLKNDIEEVYQQGLRQLDLKKFIENTMLPVVFVLLTCLAAPYAIGRLTPLIADVDQTVLCLLHWRAHSFIILNALFVCFCIFGIKRLQRLHDRIKDERYLIELQPVDYEPC
ncbi:unnamed protein product [Clavelina lepadiformis]|uniref:RING-type E3 ubiquitin transferase n=1 Tax=Clavelina lepadiformis TaxID=159417 RepID=A0ABP0FYV1_CLALP